jgi:threonine dehydratase
MTDRLTVADVDAAARRASERLSDIVVHTSLRPYEALSARVGANVQLKLENEQHTGSFKYRGAVNRLLTLDEGVRQRGVVVASSGNHGAAVARAMRDLDTQGIIFVPEHVSERKLATIRDLGADVRLYGENGLDTELHARAHAEETGMFYLSPYNDPEVIAGQGSIGVELLEDMQDLDVAIIAVGGGGLLAGVASVLKTARPDVRIVAVQPSASAVMALSVEAGRIVDADDEPTLSDGTAGGIEDGAITFELVRELADEFVLIPEFEIARAMRDLEDETGLVIEGAAALTLAAINIDGGAYRGQNVMALICGGNIAPDTVSMARSMAGGVS